MTDNQRLVFWLGINLVLIIIVSLVFSGLFGVRAEANPCPPGSYLVDYKAPDRPICKLDPTGCPFGDSIPMEHCSKFDPIAPTMDIPSGGSPNIQDRPNMIVTEGGK